MKPSPIPPPPAPSASANGSNGRSDARRTLFAAACALPLALAGCLGNGTAISDTYCRDTFYWRTGARDTEETRRQADLHNSRRLCRCEADCS